MGFIIENNGFANDSRGVRGTRLSFISGNIDTYSAELEIEAALLAWAQGASAPYDAAIIDQTDEIGEKDEAYQTSQEADSAMYDRYVQLRELLKSRYGDDDDALHQYGISGPIPAGQKERFYKAQELIKENEERLAAGDPKALPAGMVLTLTTLTNDVEAKYKATGVERIEAKQATDTLNALFDADSIQLRVLYNWCVAYWGNKDPRLIALGFVQAKSHGGGQPDAPLNFYYDNITSEFIWDAVATATSYQCAMQDASVPGADWNEIYNGPEPRFPWPSVEGHWNVKVRARNANGFGDWSNEISILVPPAP